QAGAVHAGVDDGVGGVDGCALGAVDGGRVSEVDVLLRVVGWDEHVVAGVLVADGQGAVFGESGDGEQLSVDDSPERGSVGRVEHGVLAGDDGVPDTDGVTAGHNSGVGVIDNSVGDPLCPDDFVEGVDVFVSGGDDQ